MRPRNATAPASAPQMQPEPPTPAPMPAPIATTERGKSGSNASQSAAITDSPQFMWSGPGLLLALAAASTAPMLTLSVISPPPSKSH